MARREGKIQIVVALIGLIGVLGAALITNLNTIFPQQDLEEKNSELPKSSPDLIDSEELFLKKLQVINLRFFESGYYPPATLQRVFSKHFYQVNSRYINWQINIKHPPLKRRIDFSIRAVYYRPNDTVMGDLEFDVYADPGLTSPNSYSRNLGWQLPGNWTKGTYRVDIYIEDKKVATDSFFID